MGIWRLHHNPGRILYPTRAGILVEHPRVQEARHLPCADQHTFHGRNSQVLLRAVRCYRHAAHDLRMVTSLAAFQSGLLRTTRMVLVLHHPDDRPGGSTFGRICCMGEMVRSGSVHSLEVPQG